MLVYTMPVAQRIRERLSAAIKQVDGQATRGLDESELSQFRRTLSAIRTNLRTDDV